MEDRKSVDSERGYLSDTWLRLPFAKTGSPGREEIYLEYLVIECRYTQNTIWIHVPDYPHREGEGQSEPQIAVISEAG